MNKKILFILGFLIICFGTAFLQFKNSIPVKKGNKIYYGADLFVSIKQTIEGNEKREQIKVSSTALQLLNATHKIIMKGQKENAFVTEIDGRIADTQKKEFWAFYVNGKQAEVGAGSYVIKNNDTIEWKIETY